MENYKNQIICADVIDGLKLLPDNSVHLTVTSPPYNVGLPYKNSTDNMTYPDYLLWLKEVFTEVYRTSVSGGRCAINIDSITNRDDDKDEEYIRAIYPHLYKIMGEIGWKFRTEICWCKQNAVGKKTAWGSYQSASNPTIRRNHEYILVWSKDEWQLKSDEPSDLAKREFELWTLSTWNIQPETRSLVGHPAPFSEELVKRIIKLFSFPKQTVLDPFSGTGTTALMASVFNRDYIGIDNSPEYCKCAIDRIDIFATQIKETEEQLRGELDSYKSSKKFKKMIIEEEKKDKDIHEIFTGDSNG